MYCRRCDDVVRAIVPWVGWKRLKVAWWVGVLALLPLSPILGADYFCMIPSAFGFVFAGGTLFRLAAETPICSRCSLPLASGSTRRP